VVARHRATFLRSPFYFLLVWLSLTDMAMGVSVLVGFVISILPWRYWPLLPCCWAVVANPLGAYASTITLFLISFDRLMSVLLPVWSVTSQSITLIYILGGAKLLCQGELN
jgi:7 transmembrane receptor (rhodopsin family)